ncbi:hypothetical protein ACIQUS_27280 [Pseudomonas sp. NPDC090755]|uniref:hypothetical protein n=1 Tax=Pseudomonas sp. NPDC090755 TaxID=3364481 RepID=UPI00383AEBA9
MSEKSLREKIIDYMQQREQSPRGWFCTWWLKFHVSGASGTPEIRRELERMEKNGLVESDRNQSNNTKWRLIKAPEELQP